MAIESEADDIASIILELLRHETVNVRVVQLTQTLRLNGEKSKKDIFNGNKCKHYKPDK